MTLAYLVGFAKYQINNYPFVLFLSVKKLLWKAIGVLIYIYILSCAYEFLFSWKEKYKFAVVIQLKLI